MATEEGLRYIDSDGHILEHPTAMPEYAPAEYRDRIWHVETDEAGEEWLALQRPPDAGERHVGGGRRGRERRGPGARVPRRDALHRDPSRGLEREGAPPGHGPGPHRPRRAVPDDAPRPAERADVDFAEAQARAYNDWCSDHVQEGEGRLFGAGAVPPMHEPDDVDAGGGRDPPGGRAAGHGVGVHAPEPRGRLAAVQRPRLRPDLAGGVRHRPADRAAPVLRARPSRARAWACAWRGPGIPTAATSTTSTRTGS